MWILTLRSVLVATDLEESSRPALVTAARLAPLAGAKLHILYVASSPIENGEARVREEFALAAPDAAEPESVTVMSGSPAAAIVNRAVRTGADAILLGPHGRTARGAAEIGSTAAEVVLSAPCPCLVVARELELPLQRVTAPVDLSETAEGTLSVALSWASALRPRGGRCQLTALHVSANDAASTGSVEAGVEVARARGLAGEAAQVDVQDLVIPASDPAAEILRHAEAGLTDLLVMGTRGAGHASSGLGSVTTAVIRATSCPVLLVPPDVWREYAGVTPRGFGPAE